MKESNLIIKKQIAECVGLWRAEGDNKTRMEITFTNNCFNLISYFHNVMKTIFVEMSPRIYIYSASGKYTIKVSGIRIKHYKDTRARRPYFIYRIASVKNVSIWKNIVHETIENKENYADILRGFFAGEGNIKEGAHYNRAIRIAQKQRIRLIDDILAHFSIKFNFRDRSYVITSKYNWDKLAKINIADLHPEKKKRFWRVFNEFQEYHYRHNFIKDELISHLKEPMTSEELSKTFNRSQSRLQRVLTTMKNEGSIINFRVHSKDIWIRKDSNMVIISDVKQNYLKIMTNPMTTKNISNVIGVCWKSAHRRLGELERLGLVEKRDYLWYKTQVNKEVKVL